MNLLQRQLNPPRWQRTALVLASVISLIAFAGCGTSWFGRKEEPVPTGRFIKDAVSLYEMGRQLEIHGNYVSAIDKYEESIRVSPRPVAYYALGSLQGELRQFEPAKENIRKAIELSPGFAEARRELERVEAVEKLIERGEPIPESFRIKPVPPSLSDKEKKAREPGVSEEGSTIAGPDEVAAERPPSAPSPETVGGATPDSEPPDLITQEVHPEAEKLSEEEEAKVQALVREGQDLLDNGRHAEAVQHFQEALLAFPREGRIHYYLGYSHQLSGGRRAALLAYEDALRYGYSSPSLYNNLGVLYEDLGQSHLALKAYQKAIEAGKTADPHYNLAVLLEKRGELEAALDQFEAYLALEPKGEYAERARARADRLRRRVK